MRSAHLFGHQLPQRFDQIGHVAAPDRLRSPGDFESLPGKDVFQSIKGKVGCKFTGHDETEQTRCSQPLFNRHLRLSRSFDPRVLAVVFASRASILLAHMMEPLEMAGIVLDLPALVRADLLALNTAAGTGPLFSGQFVYMLRDWQVFEVGQVPPALAPANSPKLFLRFRMRRN